MSDTEIDCGDNSCLFATRRGGMRTNGGCRCLENAGFGGSSQKALRQMLPEVLRLRSEVERLTASNRAIVAQRDRLQAEHEADRETIAAALRAENLRLSREVSQ